MLEKKVKITADGEQQRVGIVLIPGFSMVGFSATIEPVFTANRLSSRKLFDISILSQENTAPASSSGFCIPVNQLIGQTTGKFDLVVVCAGFFDRQVAKSARLLDWLRKQASFGATIGAISTGAEILANAGLLNGHKCTIHWENEESFRESHPAAILTGGSYEVSSKRITAAGGITALDMMLNWISQNHDEYLVTSIAEQFLHTPSQPRGSVQKKAELQLAQRRSPKLAQSIEIMMENIENPKTSTQIARKVGLSRRQMERLFVTHRHKTPHLYYLELRLNHARYLLFHSRLSLLQISIATGFSSQSHFARRYKVCFQSTPSKDRHDGIS